MARSFFDNAGTDGYPKVICGFGQLVQLGTGTLVIATNEAYPEPTTISNGIVLLRPSWIHLNTASIAINAGATLDASAVSGGFTCAALRRARKPFVLAKAPSMVH